MSNCLVCREPQVEEFLDLGTVPLANALLQAPPARAADEARYPLRVGYCGRCHAVQLLHLVPPEQLFSNYFYESSFTSLRTIRKSNCVYLRTCARTKS